MRTGVPDPFSPYVVHWGWLLFALFVGAMVGGGIMDSIVYDGGLNDRSYYEHALKMREWRETRPK